MKKFEYLEDEQGNLNLCIVSDERFKTLTMQGEGDNKSQLFALEVDEELERILIERYGRLA